MSLTNPFLIAPNDPLNQAHHRIRDHEADEPELGAHIRPARAVTTGRIHQDHARSAGGLAPSPVSSRDDAIRTGSTSAINEASSQPSEPGPLQCTHRNKTTNALRQSPQLQ
ncbi:hypothetical protein GCM10010533_31650 [Mycolicibacterium pallens]